MAVGFGTELHADWSRSQVMAQLAKMWKAAAPEEKLKYEVMPLQGVVCPNSVVEMFCACVSRTPLTQWHTCLFQSAWQLTVEQGARQARSTRKPEVQGEKTSARKTKKQAEKAAKPAKAKTAFMVIHRAF